MSVTKRLNQHAFFEFLNTHGQPGTQAWLDQVQERLLEGKMDFGMPLKLADEQNYLWRVNETTNALLSATTRLEQCRAFIGALSADGAGTGGVSLAQTIEYHVAYYSVTITSLIDVALVLAGQVLRLGIPPKECKWHVIVKNDWVVWTGVADELKAIDALVQKYRTTRNHHVHSGVRIDVAGITNDTQYPIYRVLEYMHEIQAQTPVEIDPAMVEDSRTFLRNGYTLVLDRICATIDGDLAAWEERLMALLQKLLPPMRFLFGMNEGIRHVLGEAATRANPGEHDTLNEIDRTATDDSATPCS